MVNRLVHGSFCYVLTINHLSNHSYLVYTIDVSVILSVVLPRQTALRTPSYLPRLSGENNAQHDRHTSYKLIFNIYLSLIIAAFVR